MGGFLSNIKYKGVDYYTDVSNNNYYQNIRSYSTKTLKNYTGLTNC